MAARLWLVLLCALGLVLAPARPAHAMPGGDVLAEQAVAQAALDRGVLVIGAPAADAALASAPEHAIGPDAEPIGDCLRTSEGVELLVGVGRLLTDGRPGVMSPAVLDAASEVAPEARRTRGRPEWCDVVQCRRCSGARLLRWATAPPRG